MPINRELPVDEYTLRFGETLITMPWWWLYALTGWLAIMGLILFFLGQRLVKPTFAILGLVLGAVLTLSLVKTQWPDAPAMPIAIGAALVFGVLFLVLWRIWMAAVFSDFVAVLAPVLMLVASGISAPAVHTPIGIMLAEVADASGVSVEANDTPSESDTESEDPPSERDTDDSDADAPTASGGNPAELGPILLKGVEDTRTIVTDWWGELESSTRWGLVAISVGGSIVAFVLALALPMFGASMVTSFLGTLLMLPGFVVLTRLVASDTALAMTSSPRGLVIGVAIATIIGAAIQWMLLRPPADK